MQKRIAVDTTFFGHDEIKKGTLSLSTSIFTADLLDAFCKIGAEKNFTLIVNFNHEEFFKNRFPSYKIIAVKSLPSLILYKISRGKKAASKFAKKFGAYKKILEKNKFDAVWFPYAMDETFVKSALPSFATIHDIYRIHHGKKIQAKKFASFINDKKTSLVAVSAYTKNDIEKTCRCTKKISVVPNSVFVDISRTKPLDFLRGKKFILDINAYIEKKNPFVLLKAFDSIKNETDFDLVFCGGYKDESVFGGMKEFVEKNNLQNRVFMLHKIAEEEKNFLLQNASIFVTPSLFEGFGRTPVEAQICRIPVISTKETSLFEATMGLASYLENSADEKELAELILQKIKNPPDSQKLEKISAEISENYRSENCAKKYLEIFMNGKDEFFTGGGGKTSH